MTSKNFAAALPHGHEALALATHCVSLQPAFGNHVGTLAAAYARCGDFREAVRQQKKAIQLFERGLGTAEHLSGARQRLSLYRLKRP